MSVNDLGESLYVASAHPATYDAAGYEALSWTEVGGFASIGARGLTSGNIDSPSMKTGHITGLKGASSGREVSIVMEYVASDSGQAALKAAAAASNFTGLVSIKVGKGSGTGGALTENDPVEYFAGYAKNWESRNKDTTTAKGYSVIVHQNHDTVEDTEPAA